MRIFIPIRVLPDEPFLYLWMEITVLAFVLLEQHMRHVCWMVGLLLVGLHDVSSVQGTQEGEERAAHPRSSQDVSAATGKFEKAVNGNAIVRNRCRSQGKDIEIEETAEVIERDRCKLVVKTRKVTRSAARDSAGGPAQAEKKSSTDRQPPDGNVHSATEVKEIEFIRAEAYFLRNERRCLAARRQLHPSGPPCPKGTIHESRSDASALTGW